MTNTNSRPCKACGKKLIFARDEMGKLQPLDATAPVYRVDYDANGEPIAIRCTLSFVSHFSTCPSANEFSKGKRSTG